ncbi:MAG: hypothetical protein KGN34_02035 [Sphingomonadales bacterium]|nr:hypothetical protein [Sphingomonadales bacterium]
MRVALLTMIEPAGGPSDSPGAGVLRGALNLGGVSLARHQLGTMLAVGCDRVICVAQSLDQEMLALQQVAEHAGARFHVVSGPHGLLGLVTATDEILALADGQSADTAAVRELLDHGPVVLVQPVVRGLQDGYERIDADQASGGAWRIPGRLVERLAELPPDADPFSALMRIALQAGITRRAVPDAMLASGRWKLVRGEGDAHALERDWIRLHVGISGPGNPTFLAAQMLVRRFGGALLHSGTGGNIVAAGGVATLLTGLVAGWFGHGTIGFGMAALAWLVFLVAALLGKVSRATLRLPRPRFSRIVAYGALVDVLLVVLTAWSMRAGSRGQLPFSALFAAVVLVSGCRLVGSGGRQRWRVWLQDRGLLAIALSIGSAFGALGWQVQGMAIGVIVAGLAAQRVAADSAAPTQLS